LLDYNDVWGWETNYLGVSAGSHDISQDPLFRDVFCGDCEDFRPSPGSPCIDTADNTQAPADDRDNAYRPQDGDADGTAIADMGAYEYFVTDVFTLTCGASGIYTTTDGVLTFEWEPEICLSCTITITYAALGNPGWDTGDLDFGNLAFRLWAVDCHGNSITELSVPISLTVHYDSRPPATADENTMDIYRLDTEGMQWMPLTVLNRDVAANSLTVRLEHFSMYALLVDKLEIMFQKVNLPIILK
jgi:hypothetical protein